jgi:protein-tyrosine phosphatase
MYSAYDDYEIQTNNIDQITDRLFIGGINSRDPALLTHHDIKHVIGLLTIEERIHISSVHKTIQFEPEFKITQEYKIIECVRLDDVPIKETLFDVEDSIRTSILPIIDTIKTLVDAAPDSDRILIHCRAGISRSATVILALLMYNGYSLADATELVERVRPAINPNKRFVTDLNELENTINRAKEDFENEQYMKEWHLNNPKK